MLAGKKDFPPELLLFALFPLVGFLLAFLILSQQRPLNAERVDLEAGWQAVDFELPLLSGGSVRLADYQGQLLFLNFWETTCKSCEQELPAFQTFLDEHPSEDVSILTVNGRDTPEAVSTYLNRLSVNRLPVALDTDLNIRRAYGVIGLPTTFVIDSSGIVRSIHLGELTLADLQHLTRKFASNN